MERPLAWVVERHDGKEYVALALGFASADIAGLPPEALRHDPGLSLFLSPFAFLARFFPDESSATALLCYFAVLLAAFGATWVYYSFLLPLLGLGRPARLRLALALAIGYPTFVYFSCFIMSEPLFVLLTIAATYYFLRGKSAPAYVLAGLTALVRTPGVFLPAAFVAADFLTRRERQELRLKPLAWGAAALLPWAAWHLSSRWLWGFSPVTLFRPELSYPLAAFEGLPASSPTRAVYNTAALLFFCLSTALLARDAHRAGWRDRFAAAGAIFSALFIVFHLSLRTLWLRDHAVWTFEFQDRYLAVLLPFALYPWRRFVTAGLLVLAAVASLLLSAYWGYRYLSPLES